MEMVAQPVPAGGEEVAPGSVGAATACVVAVPEGVTSLILGAVSVGASPVGTMLGVGDDAPVGAEVAGPLGVVPGGDVAVAVGAPADVALGTPVGVSVGASVWVGVALAVGVDVGVSVGAEVGVAVAEGPGVADSGP